MRALGILALALCACSGPGGKTTGGGAGTGTAIAAPCAELTDSVRKLYASEQSGNPDLDADLLEANVHMVLSDCSTAPDKFTACIRTADSIASLERDCLVPLDDKGTVEGRRFAQ